MADLMAERMVEMMADLSEYLKADPKAALKVHLMAG